MDANKAHYVVATAIIVKDGKYLITRRSEKEKAFPGLWTVPGGKLELNDYKNMPKDTEDCWYNIFEHLIEREIMEETGLKVKNIRYLTSLSFIRLDSVPTVVVSFFADYDSGEVKLNNELIDHTWIDLKEAGNFLLIGGIYEELEMLDNYLKSNFLKEWKRKLSPEQYHVLREKGTEKAFTGKLLENKEKGKYVCAGCGTELFKSDAKFESGTGWPSFSEASENVGKRIDNSHGMTREEVYCKKCNGHLGHVFDDGPKSSGKRFCINSCSLNFRNEKKN